MTEPIIPKRVRLNECEVEMICGKLVASGVAAPKRTPGDEATPWSASDHHW